jgi:hypothetical protein
MYFKAILGPLLSNSTFLHILLKQRYLTPEAAGESPKYPGNALEILAGALAIFMSLEDVATWISELYDLPIKKTVEAWKSFHKYFFLIVTFTCSREIVEKILLKRKLYRR